MTQAAQNVASVELVRPSVPWSLYEISELILESNWKPSLNNIAVQPLAAPHEKILLKLKELFLQRVGKATLKVYDARDIQIT